jgi:hypothetical protein
MMKQRKIIQIAIGTIAGGFFGDHWVATFALCDDGSLWKSEATSAKPKGTEWARVDTAKIDGTTAE